MAINSMITHTLRLDPVPGGVMPEVHLKEGCTSAVLKLIVVTDDGTPFPQGMKCVIRGKRPDGSALFLRGASARENGMVLVELPGSGVREMAGIPGKYKCTLTFLEAEGNVTRENYMNFDFLTVLPFTVIVHAKA